MGNTADDMGKTTDIAGITSTITKHVEIDSISEIGEIGDIGDTGHMLKWASPRKMLLSSRESVTLWRTLTSHEPLLATPRTV